MDYKVVFIAHFQTSYYRKGGCKMGEKEFPTKWEAEQFIHQWKKENWFAERCWVEQKVIDLRSTFQKAFDEKVSRMVDRYIAKNSHRNPL